MCRIATLDVSQLTLCPGSCFALHAAWTFKHVLLATVPCYRCQPQCHKACESVPHRMQVPREKSPLYRRLCHDFTCKGCNGVQGSFERVGELAVGASVPADYLQTAEQHAAEGCYVLAMAHRLAPCHRIATYLTN